MVTAKDLVAQYVKRVCSSNGVLPRFDATTNVLFFGEEVVKRFRQASPNQQLILITFEELGWPYEITDPIPPSNGVCSRECLANAVKRLNRSQQNPRLRFRVADRGESVAWCQFL